MFLHCFLGKLVTDRYDQLSIHLYQSDWYNLPNGLQKYFILMIQNAQWPSLEFDGLDIYVLDLEAFATVSLNSTSEMLYSTKIYYIYTVSHFQSMNHVYFYSMIFRSIVEPSDEIHIMHLEIL